MATFPPFSTMACATARPMPEAPPVITTPAPAMFMLAWLLYRYIYQYDVIDTQSNGCAPTLQPPGLESVSLQDGNSTIPKHVQPLWLRRDRVSLDHVRAGGLRR